MKVGWIHLFAAVSVLSGVAQDATAPVKASKPSLPAPPRQEIQIDAPQVAKESQVNTNLLANPNPARRKNSRFSYGGLFTDVARSTNRWKMFSLRRPVDPDHDGENLMDAHTKNGPALKLFSIGFK